MKRRRSTEGPGSTAEAFEQAVQMWTVHPDMLRAATDPWAPGEDVHVWSDDFHQFCAAHGLDSIAVTVEASHRGLTDAPWTPILGVNL